MLNCLRKTISINNLKSHKPKGQVATLLMLVIVAILIFIFTTVNLGKLSLTATTVSNAVDSTTLLLASTLASKANAIWYQLGEPPSNELEKCTRGGWLGVFAAIGLAIAGFFTGGATWAMLLAMAGGAAGQAIVTHSVTGAIRGAVMGAAIGAAVAGGLAAMGFGASSATVNTVAAGVVTDTAATPLEVAVSSMHTSLASAGMLATHTLGATGGIYENVSATKADASALRQLTEQINKITDDYIRTRETVFFDALSKIVDDPEKVRDAVDMDADGDEDDTVSRFLYKYYTEHLPKVTVAQAADIIKRFQEALQNYIAPDSPLREFLRWLNRHEIECSDDFCYNNKICCNLCYDSDDPNCASKNLPGPHPDITNTMQGAMIDLFDKFRGCGYNLSFWQPGPDKSALEQWYQCGDCTQPPAGFDVVDGVRMNLEDFIVAAKKIVEKDPVELDRNHDWVSIFYWAPQAEPQPPEPLVKLIENAYAQGQGEEERADLYYILDRIAGGERGPNPEECNPVNKGEMGRWECELYELRMSTPKCQLAYGAFTPEVIRQENDQPCGKPYSPDYYNLAEEERQNVSPFYPCVWKRHYLDNGGETGPFITNPICRSNAGHRDKLITELDTIENTLRGLEQEIADYYRLNPPNIEQAEVYLVKLSLTNPGKQTNCYKGAANTANSLLQYQFYLTYKCAGQTCRYPEKEGEFITKAKELAGVNYVVEIKEAVTDGTKSAKEKFFDIITNGTFKPNGRPVASMRSFAESIAGSPDARYATTDADGDNEFGPVIKNLSDWRKNLVELRDEIKNFYDELQEADRARPTDGSGIVWYEWQDSQGRHKVTVETGPFMLAKTEERSSGNFLLNKKCTVLINYCENTPGCPYNLSQGVRTWVRITREDPAGTSVGAKKNVLGKWNPYDTGEGKIKIIREAVAYYSYDKVGILRKRIRR